MTIIPTEIQDCFIIDPLVHHDGRGYFYEYYNDQNFKEVTGLNVEFVQDNCAFSKGKVLRGLHYQTGKSAQAKLISVLRGKVQDVIVDMREKSPSFQKVVSLEISEQNKQQVFIPRGCAHGYLTLTNDVLFFYKCDNHYDKESEAGLYYADESIKIEWMEDLKGVEISDKDKELTRWEVAPKF